MNRKNGVFRMVAMALCTLVLSQGVAKSAAPDFRALTGAYTGTVSFPTTFFNIPVVFTGPAVLLVTTKGAVANVEFICAIGAPQAIGVGLDVTGKLKSNGSIAVNGQLNGAALTPTASKYKLRGKTLSTSFLLADTSTVPTTINVNASIKFAGKTATVTGPVGFNFAGTPSTGTFTFKGKRLLQQ